MRTLEKKKKSVNKPSLMATEARQTPIKVRQQLLHNAEAIKALVERIKKFNPHTVMLVGRGSSDHAALFAKYLIEIELGIPTFSAAPSVTSIYKKKLQLAGVLVIILSQSGQSPDIVIQAKISQQSAGLCVAIVNEIKSPLTKLVDFVIPIYAGVEKSVAATKSFLATLTVLLQLVAYWKKDSFLLKALNHLPAALSEACHAEKQLTIKSLENTSQLIILGRGFGYAIAMEIALKLKELCSIQAEAFSSAEFLHGPVALLQHGVDIINIEINDESLAVHRQLLEGLKAKNRAYILLHQIIKDAHPRIAPLLVLQRFYLDLERAAVALGYNPDRPRGLKKITLTL